MQAKGTVSVWRLKFKNISPMSRLTMTVLSSTMRKRELSEGRMNNGVHTHLFNLLPGWNTVLQFWTTPLMIPFETAKYLIDSVQSLCPIPNWKAKVKQS